jgi:hypothetical protein
MGIESNISFYNADSWKRGKGDMILDVVWGAGQNNPLKEFVEFIQAAEKFKPTGMQDESEGINKMQESSQIS